MVMKKIFEGVSDEEIHAAFLKFGRGEYKNKFSIEGKKQAGNWSIKAGNEYANILVKKCLEKINGEVNIEGVIVSTRDLSKEAGFYIAKVSNFQGIRKHAIKDSIKPEKIIELMDKYPKAFFALSFKGDDFVLKIKAKAPTSGKPGKEKDEEVSPDFCSLKTQDKKMVDYLFFEIGDFKEVKVSYNINITDIAYPSNIDKLSPTEIREQSKRKGKIIRTAIIDGKEKKSETNFVA